MQTEYVDLKFTLSLEKFQQLQDKLARITDLAILTVDYKGHPVTRHSRSCQFCNKIRQIPEYGLLCEKSDSRGGLEAVMAGQVMLLDKDKNGSLERVYYDRKRLAILENDQELKELYDPHSPVV